MTYDKNEIQIYVDLKKFFNAFYTAQFLMPKRDRIEIGSSILTNTSKCMMMIRLANEIISERASWLRKAFIHWGVVTSYMELVNENKMLLNPSVKNLNNKIINLYELIDRIEIGIIKWYKYTLFVQTKDKTSN